MVFPMRPDRKSSRPVSARKSAAPQLFRFALLVFAILGACSSLPAAESPVVRGADELFWVPTLEQGLAMASATGRPLFLMGYSLVPDGSTYTKLREDFCSGVF
jgi:hypothetical protein